MGSETHTILDTTGLTINKEIFSQQLLDIDLALQKYENHGILHGILTYPYHHVLIQMPHVTKF